MTNPSMAELTRIDKSSNQMNQMSLTNYYDELTNFA